jgi:GR25 family glycosyltransferase involved in LPS biosynthesis
MENIQFFCLNYKNEKRKQNMEKRFEQVDINCKFIPGVDFVDNRIVKHSELLNDGIKRVWSCMYGHLDMLNDFYYNTNKEYGIFCEDDIYIHKNIKKYLPRICLDFNTLNLDVLLLGYLLQCKPTDVNSKHLFPTHELRISKSPFTYHSFPDDVWGTQMYMLSRKHAKYLLDKYMYGYAEMSIKSNNEIPFSADWTLTKEGNRALISPILAVEDNSSIYQDFGQRVFHKECFDAHYDISLFVT